MNGNKSLMPTLRSNPEPMLTIMIVAMMSVSANANAGTIMMTIFLGRPDVRLQTGFPVWARSLVG